MPTTNKQKEYILESVKRFWFGYKVCEGCDTLLAEEMPVCPVCRAYRFDDTKDRIIETVNDLLEKDFFTQNTDSSIKEYSNLDAEKEK